MPTHDNVEVIENSEVNELIENLPELPLENGIEEPRELTEEEKREIFIQELKESKKTYHPKKDFGANYKAKRQRKNREAKKSRKANRK